jgi:hypothetical protein
MKLRYERKYLVNNSILTALRSRLVPFVKPDKFAVDNLVYPEYTVRSIYFDTPTMDALMDKVEGLNERRKLRIRGYDAPDSNTKVFMEIKRKIGNRIGKNRALVPWVGLSDLLEWGTSPEHAIAKEDQNKFLFYLNKENQQPVNLIVYDREPYLGRFDKTVRVTFDKNIRSKFKPDIFELFSNDNLTSVWPSHFILEIKYDNAPMPSWAKSIVEEFNLSSQALSKYAEGYFCHKLKLFS